ncbi:MAG: hypothetical protein JMDDDDMK_01220 [Acidobacteria bacterium]|nr:hypothetical protein [Acidobacteriota bacterium]
MNQTLAISESLYSRLQTDAQLLGLTIEQLIEQAVEEWKQKDAELKHRAELKRRGEEVDRINAIYERMKAKYGRMPDSVELIREDRER